MGKKDKRILGIGKGKGPKTPWTAEQEEIVMKYYPDYGYSGPNGVGAKLMELLGIHRNRGSVNARAHKLGCYYKGPTKGAFQKGFVPYNKGKKMPDWVKKKIEHTWFPKGHLPHNTRSMYDLRYQYDKTGVSYWMVKLGHRHWELLHRVIYSNYYGEKLTKDDIVYFKNRDTDDIRPDNLGKISKVMNLYRNNPRLDYPEEILQSMEILNSLNKIIKSQKDAKS